MRFLIYDFRLGQNDDIIEMNSFSGNIQVSTRWDMGVEMNFSIILKEARL